MTKIIEPEFQGRWAQTASTLHVARIDSSCRALGPGNRAVVWLQGCCFRCPGCVAPEMLPFRGGAVVAVEDLARRLLGEKGIDGITFSGGEPFMQAKALVALIDQIRTYRDLSFMSYSGFTLEELRARRETGQMALLARLDLLVDGRYRREEHATLLWRGSRNQRIHFLSDRHVDLHSSVEKPSVSLDMTIDEDGGFQWAGISPQGFQQALESGLTKCGIAVTRKGVK